MTRLKGKADEQGFIKAICTLMTLSFPTHRSGQTVQTQIRLLLEEQSDQDFHCLPFAIPFASFFRILGRLQCSHSNFKLGVFIPPMYKICEYEVKFTGMTFYLEKVLGRNGHGLK